MQVLLFYRFLSYEGSMGWKLNVNDMPNLSKFEVKWFPCILRPSFPAQSLDLKVETTLLYRT